MMKYLLQTVILSFISPALSKVNTSFWNKFSVGNTSMKFRFNRGGSVEKQTKTAKV